MLPFEERLVGIAGLPTQRLPTQLDDRWAIIVCSTPKSQIDGRILGGVHDPTIQAGAGW